VVKEYRNFGYRVKGDRPHSESVIREIMTHPFGVNSVVMRSGGLCLALIHVGVTSKKDLWFCVH
jgi:hypothetical protein